MTVLTFMLCKESVLVYFITMCPCGKKKNHLVGTAEEWLTRRPFCVIFGFICAELCNGVFETYLHMKNTRSSHNGTKCHSNTQTLIV